MIVPELSRLGRSTLDILEILGELKRKNVNVHAVKGSWTLWLLKTGIQFKPE